MADDQVNLSNCDTEPIHIPGQIQSHGFLVVVDAEQQIQFCSDNIEQFLSVSAAELIQKPLHFLESEIGYSLKPNFIADQLNLAKDAKKFDQFNPFAFNLAGVPYHLIIGLSGGYHLLEFEPVAATAPMDIEKVIGHTLFEILGKRVLQDLLDDTATQIRGITGYDRVMVYRFAEDGHGEVVSEARKDDLPAWLGLHYPASDIPKQARELYKLKLTRLIADVNTTPSRILSSGTDPEPLNLTNSQLRAVSPIHIQYLKNMGVSSSFSISLIYQNELWGLIACHHSSPKFIDYKSRQSARLIGQILSSALEYRQNDKIQQEQEEFIYHSKQLFSHLKENDNIEAALTSNSSTILDIVKASGAILVYNNKITRLGVTPNDVQLSGLILWVQKNIARSLYHNVSISAVYPPAWFYKDIASGMMVCVLSKEIKEYIIWFKPEIIQTVNWAGNPNKSFEPQEDGMKQISPRNSFEVWKQTVTGTSADWTTEEIKSAMNLKEEIIYIINAKASALRLLNEKLTLAYEELDAFSYTISHDLKNPLAVIKSYAQLLERDKSLGQQGKDFLKRISDRADKMNVMISEVLNYSRVGRLDIVYKSVDIAVMVKDIIADLKLLYASPDLHISTGEMPNLHGDRTMILQVFSNLISNAVKYSQQSRPSIIHIEGEVNAEETCYSVRDNGLGIVAEDHPKLFELFNRLDNAKDIEGSGVGLAIVKRIISKHQGRIWVESNLGAGSVFYVAFRHPTPAHP
ncbi:ATP-binding protein [Pedobacter hartonius]|uniref:histidine kinase n=1 Tax=Pedobacter hartonius TaxID=425514 RepID=A0A1H4H9X4_9SPHI|nr:ATP-binding protein [Pedobacter hartonius]SEB18495.1 Bacteriophytochrome (light-regulated signal transduction histidine kinase) [Pedobacter hartonius]